MLGDAVNRPQATNEGTAIDSDYSASRKMRAKKVYGPCIGWRIEGRDEYGGVPNIEVGVTGGITVVRTIGSRRHGEFDDLKSLAASIFGKGKSFTIVG